MSEQVASTDILRLFSQDLTTSDRVEAFRQASELLRTEVEALATPENIDQINNHFNLTVVLNSHGDGIDAGQSVRCVENPFITFVESAGEEDINTNGFFSESVKNAFNIKYNGQAPITPPYPLTQDNSWHYWRDRGLLAKGSVVMPIDIRHYSKRLLDALMGEDYDQGMLNKGVTLTDLRNKDYPELVEEQYQKGLLITYSNAVRELTSTKQIVQTLLACLQPTDPELNLDGASADKINALVAKHDGKLAAYAIYGTAHHSIYHVLKGLGINVRREFPGGKDQYGFVKFAGSVKDQFFSAHPFEPTEEMFKKYATQYILESMLWTPLSYPYDYGLVPASDQDTRFLHPRISRLARDPELVENAQSIIEQFKSDLSVPVNILKTAGVDLRSITE